MFAKCFRIFLDRNNYPIDFHCIAGADRTGALALVLYGILGVSEADIRTDYALTSYSTSGIRSARSFDKMVKILEKKQDGGLRGIMHCFTGTEEEAKVYLELGFHLGLGGVTTYKNCGVKDYLPNLPLDRIVLETDAPYLSPVPCRGKRNEPAFLVHTAQRIADVLQIPVEELAETTTKNVQSLFAGL